MIDEQRQSLVESCVALTLELEDEIELVETKVTGRAGSPLVRLVIYAPGGITVDDCARVHRRLSRELEAVDELQKTFSIEVSSPGLDRRLQTRRDFEMAVGEVLRIRVRQDDGEETVTGLLTEVNEETLLLDSSPRKGRGGDQGQDRPRRVPLGDVVDGRIEVLL